MIYRVHKALCYWADFKLRSVNERSELGFPAITMEGRLAEGYLPCTENKKGPVVPVSIRINCAVAQIDMRIMLMDDTMKEVVATKYLADGSDAERVRKYCKLKSISYSTFMRRLHDSHQFLQDRGL